MRDGIGNRHDCLEPEFSIRITFHHASSIGPVADVVLDIIVACGICLPDIDFDIRNGSSGDVFDGAENDAWIALRIGTHLVA